MGTSTRNKGQSGHTPLVPSWLEEDDIEGQTQSDEQIPQDGDENRFSGPRKSFTQYVNGGGRDGSSMRSSVSRYISHSLGGSYRATTRLGSARSSTAKLYNILYTLSGSNGVRKVGQQLSLNNLTNLPASEFFVEIALFICPDGGPNDEGIARAAYYDAIAENPELYGKLTEELTAEDCFSVLQNYMEKVVLEHVINDIANKTIVLPDDIDQVSNIEKKVRAVD